MTSSIDLIEEYILEKFDRDGHHDGRLSDIAYEWLKEAILVLDVRSGDPVSESRLSEIFQISRTPIRTAVEKLAQEDLLQVIPGRAVVIASRSANQIYDAMNVRILLEPEMFRLTTMSMTDEDRERFGELTNQLEKAYEDDDRPAWAKVDIAWHTLLSELCPNKLLGKMVLEAFNHMRLQGVIRYISNEMLLPGTREHREIADAIIAGEGERVKSTVLDHLKSARDRMFRSIA